MGSQYHHDVVGRDPPSGVSRTAVDELLAVQDVQQQQLLLAQQIDALPFTNGRISRRTVELAKLVLVSGMSQSEAARAMDIHHRQVVHRAVKVVKGALTRNGVCKVCGQHKSKGGQSR